MNDKTISYDEIGNPTSYLGANLSWRGRELVKYEKGNKQISYSYDVDGMRYRKVVKTNGVETARYDYVYSEGRLILLTYTSNGASNTARFIYDSLGEIRGFILDNTQAYLYLKNGQGDITGIVDESGNIILTYSYTAWGKVTYSATDMEGMALAATLSNVNPFTYRGYCYDYDIGMYYLQSRYYDPQICRFINADSTDYLGATGTTLSYNLFAYCENEPVDYVDEDGYYSAKKAIDYAAKWTGKNDSGKYIKFNSDYFYFVSGDCMNFVSQCLHAGGISMDNQWCSYKVSGWVSFVPLTIYYFSPAWCKISYFIPYLHSRISLWSRKTWFYAPTGTKNARKKELFLSIVGYIEKGSVLLMDLTFDGKTKYEHAALIVDIGKKDVYYAAHTSNRWRHSLWQEIDAGNVEGFVVYNISSSAK